MHWFHVPAGKTYNVCVQSVHVNVRENAYTKAMRAHTDTRVGIK